MASLESEDEMPRVESTPSEAVSDRSLVRRFQRGQSDAPTQLYLRYAERLHALAAAQSSPDLARRVEPDEIVQSVFRTFFRRAAQGHYAIPDGEELWKLLLVIALNKVRAAGAHHRAAKRDVRLTAGGATYDRAVESKAGQDETALTILRMVVDELLEGLPEPHRKMVELRIEGHEVAEIAEKVRRSKRSVERVLQDFRSRLDVLIHEDQR
jgi:RNA polymerase sigma-70 factor, ECF subfamily